MTVSPTVTVPIGHIGVTLHTRSSTHVNDPAGRAAQNDACGGQHSFTQAGRTETWVTAASRLRVKGPGAVGVGNGPVAWPRLSTPPVAAAPLAAALVAAAATTAAARGQNAASESSSEGADGGSRGSG